MSNYEIKTGNGTFSAVELKEPNSDKTTDILAIVLITETDMQLLGYSWGASLMTDEEITELLAEEVSNYIRTHKSNNT